MTERDNRARLLDTAERLFAARGFDSVGVQDVVQAAQLTKPTLYHYFGNKLGLLETLLKSRHAALMQALHQAAEYSGDLTSTLDRLLEAQLGFVGRHPDFSRFSLSLLFTPPQHEAHPVAKALLESQHTLLMQVFHEASQHHGNMRGREQRYATAFLGLMNHTTALVLSGTWEPTPQLRRELLHQFEHGIYS